RLAGDGVRLGAWSPGPPEAMTAVAHFLGLERRLAFQAVDPHRAAPLAGAGGGLEDPQITVVAASTPLLAAGRAAGASTVAALWTGADRDTLAPAAAPVVGPPGRA